MQAAGRPGDDWSDRQVRCLGSRCPEVPALKQATVSGPCKAQGMSARDTSTRPIKVDRRFYFHSECEDIVFSGRSQEQPTVNREGLAGFPGLTRAVLGRNSRGCSVTFGVAS